METQHDNPMTEQTVLAGFQAPDGRYKRAEIDWAIANEQHIVPGLLAILDATLSNPHHIADSSKYMGHIYAAMLLGHFGIEQAHEKVIRLLSLPNELPEDLFGDVLTEHMPTIMLATCGGSVSGIQTLLQNTEAYIFSRSVAAQALTYAVVSDYIDRTDALNILGHVFQTEADSDFRSFIAGYIAELGASDWTDELKKAIADETVVPMFFHESELRRMLDQGVDACLAEVQRRMQRESLHNLHDRMSWWASFNEEPSPTPWSAMTTGKVGRNNPCPCGSGKKYKKCCLNR